MNIVATILLATCFIATHSSEWHKAYEFFDSHKLIESTLNEKIGRQRCLYAITIVAPEVYWYSSLSDKAETYTLKVLYAQTGKGDFSIGYFQMKPSFAEQIENIIKSNNELKKKYYELFILDDTPQAIRAERVSRLSSLKYQTLYLAAFYEIAESKISKWSSNKEGQNQFLKNLATIYNGGLNISESKALQLQGKKQFPSMTTDKNNYSDLVVEFFQYLTQRN